MAEKGWFELVYEVFIKTGSKTLPGGMAGVFYLVLTTPVEMTGDGKAQSGFTTAL